MSRHALDHSQRRGRLLDFASWIKLGSSLRPPQLWTFCGHPADRICGMIFMTQQKGKERRMIPMSRKLLTVLLLLLVVNLLGASAFAALPASATSAAPKATPGTPLSNQKLPASPVPPGPPSNQKLPASPVPPPSATPAAAKATPGTLPSIQKPPPSPAPPAILKPPASPAPPDL